jgi:hypothetical protein
MSETLSTAELRSSREDAEGSARAVEASGNGGDTNVDEHSADGISKDGKQAGEAPDASEEEDRSVPVQLQELVKDGAADGGAVPSAAGGDVDRVDDTLQPSTEDTADLATAFMVDIYYEVIGLFAAGDDGGLVADGVSRSVEVRSPV